MSAPPNPPDQPQTSGTVSPVQITGPAVSTGQAASETQITIAAPTRTLEYEFHDTLRQVVISVFRSEAELCLRDHIPRVIPRPPERETSWESVAGILGAPISIWIAFVSATFNNPTAAAVLILVAIGYVVFLAYVIWPFGRKVWRKMRGDPEPPRAEPLNVVVNDILECLKHGRTQPK